MSPERAPRSPSLRADLDRMEAADLGDVGLPGALHTGEPHDGWDLSRVGGHDLLPAGRTAQAELEAVLARIEADDPSVRAWAWVDAVHAHEAAQAADAEIAAHGRRGPLHGAPVGVKDLIDVSGMPTSAGSAYFTGERRRVATADAGSVRRLRAAGAVLVGKTHTHEFAFGGTTPPTRNPHDLDRIPGGSSGGSAAAVAAGHVRLALGTDTGGSVRIPAAYCGVAGLVPSPGSLEVDGVMPLAWSLDRVGLLAADVRDLAASAAALARPGLLPSTGLSVGGLRGLRIGVPVGTFAGAVDEEVIDGVRRALAMAREAGAVVVDVEIPHQWAAVAAGLTIILAEGAEEQRHRRRADEDCFGPDVVGMLAMADQLSAATYVRAQRVRRLLRCETLAALSQVDVLATPTMPNVAPRAEEVADGQLTAGGVRIGMADSHLRYNITANLAALPCGTQPVPVGPGRLPVGLEWVAAPGHDARILGAMLAMADLWS